MVCMLVTRTNWLFSERPWFNMLASVFPFICILVLLAEVFLWKRLETRIDLIQFKSAPVSNKVMVLINPVHKVSRPCVIFYSIRRSEDQNNRLLIQEDFGSQQFGFLKHYFVIRLRSFINGFFVLDRAHHFNLLSVDRRIYLTIVNIYFLRFLISAT